MLFLNNSYTGNGDGGYLSCPCPSELDVPPYRDLQEEDDSPTDSPTLAPGQDSELWEMIFTCVVLLFMFVALVSDRIGADSVMLIALTLFMASNIITVQEGLTGFSNEGVLTVMTLFVVAEGISKTGALDWYMTKLLGRPKSIASAQLRLMIPITIVSAFLNNTPVVAVMIPIVQRWAKNVNLSPQQLLIPLSFASILGGTCTLIGTSTNLVVSGLLQLRYPNDPEVQIGLFDLGVYGVPVALVGMMYVILTSRWLLPGGRGRDSGAVPIDAANEDVLLGAKLMPWSPAAGRSVKRSGLRNTGGIYLVSVHRAATGNVHRAVGQDFVLNVGDVLYFTGLVEGFGEFCEEHGMEVLTGDDSDDEDEDDNEADPVGREPRTADKQKELDLDDPLTKPDGSAASPSGGFVKSSLSPLRPVVEGEENPLTMEIGVTKESLMQADEAERSRSITRMIDMIRGVARDEPTVEEDHYLHLATPRKERQSTVTSAHKVVVTSEHGFVIVGVDVKDRPGLLLDISKGLLRLNLTLRHSEASVVADRSISIWRCELIGADLPDLEEIWSVMNTLLESIGDESGQGLKKRGAVVIRAIVTPTSTLAGKRSNEIHFRRQYKAGIVAVQKGGRNVPLVGLVFAPGDVLVLQTSNDSPLLRPPPADFYRRERTETGSSGTVNNFVKKLTKSFSGVNLDSLASTEADTGQLPKSAESSNNVNEYFIGGDSAGSGDEETNVRKDNVKNGVIVSKGSFDVSLPEEETWKDLQVLFPDSTTRSGKDAPSREFLTAMEVAPKSQLAGRTAAETGLDKLPGVFLVSIDRPTTNAQPLTGSVLRSFQSVASDGHSTSRDHDIDVASLRTVDNVFVTVSPDTPLQDGDVLWFAGGAQSVGDLRKIPGLLSFENEEVKKMNENVHDRRLVEAVIARRGPLVGKTVKQVRFRTRYGAAVIAVHRDGARIHEHPGRIKLQAGDVLLLEAGPTFIKGTADSDRAFSLLAEVEDSAPPRLRLLIPALTITVTMLAITTAGISSLLVLALLASILMCMIGILSQQEARDAVNWEVYVTIASAFGIGTALVNSGVAGGVASFLVTIGSSVGRGYAGLYGAVYLATFLISNVVTNNAAAALIFPIAMDAAEQTGADLLLMSYSVMLGASASFMSPFGYQTNLMVYGPGGYKTTDFIKIGTPMQIVLWILSTVLLEVNTGSNFYISWLASFAALVVVSALMICSPGSIFPKHGKKSMEATASGGNSEESSEIKS